MTPTDTYVPYRDPARPVPERVADLLARMTLLEKVWQLTSLWLNVDPDGGQVVPFQAGFGLGGADARPLEEQLGQGIGQISRLFGSVPVDPAAGAAAANELQRQLIEDTRLGIPAIVHEECLTGFMTLGATEFPCPLAWGAAWDPELVEQVGDTIRRQMRAVGAHQGLAPVLDVVRDARWGRVEECIAEDPYLVGVIGTAYVRGLQGTDLRDGIVATTKHFAGYSFSEGGRNMAPAHIGWRELRDLFLVPFEMAIRDGGARSVMNAYQEIDGVAVAASPELLSGVLREEWGFSGVVVADYGAIMFLYRLHKVTEGPVDAAAAALNAGLDLELPSPHCYVEPLLEALEQGLVDEATIDRSVARVLQLKFELGLFEQPYVDVPASLDLDPPEARRLARTVAERSIVLLKNSDGLLPLARDIGVVAVVGPNADSGSALLGNYTFDNHVSAHLPDAPPGPPVATVVEGIRAVVGAHTMVLTASGCAATGDDTSGFATAVDAAAAADVAVVVVGDRAGHFGMGTVGEGTDVEDLALPGVQQQLVEAVVATGTPTVVVLVTGRPYAIDWMAEHATAVVEAFFPGEEGAAALAGMLFGDVNPSGRLPVTHPSSAGQQPLSYLVKPLGRRGLGRKEVRPAFPFGHGLSYTTYEYADLEVDADVPVDGVLRVACKVRNSGPRAGDEVVQLYVRDRVASVTRPVQELKAFARVSLEPGAAARIEFDVPTDLLSFTGVDMRRIVEPGSVEVMIGASSADIRLRADVTLTGSTRIVDGDRSRFSSATRSRCH